MTTAQTVISPVNIEKRRAINIRPGDTVRVWQKIQEKGKTRTQAFEGLVLARKHGSEAGATFTVRRVSGGVGVEKIYPLYSPVIDKIEIVRRAKVRRAKLYYIREKAAREIRRQMRKMRLVDISTGSDLEEKAVQEEKEENESKELVTENAPEKIQESNESAQKDSKELETKEKTTEEKKEE